VPSVPIISLENVSFSYDGVRVLEDVDLSLKERDLICVVGPNGGGKSTLLKLILGLLRPSSGRISILGTAPARARRRIGYMPQYAHHDPQFPITVMDVVLMGRLERRWGGPYSAEDKVEAKAALAELGLMDLRGRLFNALSGGQRQRVLIARALAAKPDLLILDEPTANVDAVIEARFYDILRELNRRMTIVMATHDLGFVSDIVTSVVCVNRRVVVHPTSELTGDMIQDIYGGEVRAVHHDRGTGSGHGHA
jgi:zinc transport system ATP-binding protein